MVIFAKDIIAWTGKCINKLKSCESYELYGKFPVCKGMEKFSSILLEQPTETGRMFDNGLFLAFLFGFFSFLVISIYTIFVEDSKSLKEISNKVIRTTDTIVTVLRTMWTLKVSKESNAILEHELIEIKKPKVLLPPSNSYISLERMKPIHVIPKEPKESEAIEFDEQIEFSLNDEWHPPKDNENKKCVAEKSTSLFGQGEPARDLKKSTPRAKSRILSNDSNLHILYEKKAEPFLLEARYDEESVSHGEHFSESRWSITNFNKHPSIQKFHKDVRQESLDFQSVNRLPSRISHLSFSSKKYRSNDSASNELSGKGIFDMRRREKAKARRTKSIERNSAFPHREVKYMTVNIKSNKLNNRENRPPITNF